MDLKTKDTYLNLWKFFNDKTTEPAYNKDKTIFTIPFFTFLSV